MRPALKALLIIALLLAGTGPLAAADKPTAEQVHDLTLKAAAIVAKEGIERARERFHADGEFKWGEIYVNVIDRNGTWLIYPPHPRNEGKSVLNVRDAEGKLLVQEIIAIAESKGEGWVEYHWLNPATNRIEPKMSYVKLIASRDAIAYIGLYK